MTASRLPIREQLIAAREHVVAASVALNDIKLDFTRARDLDRADDAYDGVVLLADVISAIDLLLMTDVGQ